MKVTFLHTFVEFWLGQQICKHIFYHKIDDVHWLLYGNMHSWETTTNLDYWKSVCFLRWLFVPPMRLHIYRYFWHSSPKATHNKALSFIQIRSINVLLFLLSSIPVFFTTWRKYNFLVVKKLYDIYLSTTRCLSVNGLAKVHLTFWLTIFPWNSIILSWNVILSYFKLIFNFQGNLVHWHTFDLVSKILNISNWRIIQFQSISKISED